MSFAPYKNYENVSGIVSFGLRGSEPVFTSVSDIVLSSGGGTSTFIQSPHLRIADGGNIGSVSDPDAIAIAGNGDVTFSQSVSITQDLTVNGTLTTIATDTLVVEDPLIFMASGNYASDTVDIGFFGVYDSGGSINRYAGLFRDADDDKFHLFHQLEAEPTTTVNKAGAAYTVATLVANLEGAADTLSEPRYIGVSGQVDGSGVFDGSSDVVVNTDLNNLAITDQIAEATPDNNDLILIFDDTAGALRKQTRGQFVSGLGAGSMDSFRVSGDAPGSIDHVINDNERIVLVGGSGIQVYSSGTDAVSFDLKVDDSTIAIVTDTVQIKDNGVTETQLNTSVAGSGIAGGGGTALSLDFTELGETALVAGDYLVFSDQSDGGNPKRDTINDVATLLGGDGLGVAGATLSVNAGSGLAINSDNVDVEFAEFPAVALGSGDSFALLDQDGEQHIRVTITELANYLSSGASSNLTTNGSGQLFATGGFNSFTITDGSTPQTINDGDTITFSDSSRINFTTSATDTVSADLIANSVSETYLAASVAGDGLGGGAGSPLAVNTDGTTIETNADTLRIATGAAGDGLTGGGGSALSVNVDDVSIAIVTDTLEVKADGITEARRFRDCVTQTSATLSVTNEDVVLCDASSNNITVTLPDNGGTPGEGRIVYVKKTDSTANTVTIARDTGDTIDGATSVILYSQWEAMTFVNDGSNWFII